MSQSKIRTRGKARPVKKHSEICFAATVTSYLNTLTLSTAVPYTYVGGHIQGTIVTDSDTDRTSAIALIRGRKGKEPASGSELSLANGDELYEPVEDILWSKVVRFTEGSQIIEFDDKIKTMRKLNLGEYLYILAHSTNTNGLQFAAHVNSFIKYA